MTEPTERAREIYDRAIRNANLLIGDQRSSTPHLTIEQALEIGREECINAIAAAHEEGRREAIAAKCDVIIVGRHTLVQLAKSKEVRLTMSDGNQVILIHASDYPHELATMEELF